MTKYHNLPISLQQAVIQRLRLDLTKANRKLNTNYPEPTIYYKQKGTIAGSASLTHWEIQLNLTLLIENGQIFIDEVVPHELAHLIAFRYFGKVAPHGHEWKHIMTTILGVPANRTHSFNIHSVQRNTWLYHCRCQQHLLTIRRHNRVLQGKVEYRCRCCGERLVYEKELLNKCI